MAYATEQDILDRHGERLLRSVADRNRDGAHDTATVARALEDASAEIDTYIGLRYVTPLRAPVPDIVRIAAVEIAVYRMANGTAGLTEDVRKRYEDFIALLKEIGRGNARLPGAEERVSSDPTESDTVIYPKVGFGRTGRV